jgi:hypothetical protein
MIINMNNYYGNFSVSSNYFILNIPFWKIKKILKCFLKNLYFHSQFFSLRKYIYLYLFENCNISENIIISVELAMVNGTIFKFLD